METVNQKDHPELPKNNLVKKVMIKKDQMIIKMAKKRKKKRNQVIVKIKMITIKN